jgi:uncharacterized damage-inducible protein DinB
VIQSSRDPDLAQIGPTFRPEPIALRPLIGLLHQLFDLVETLTPEQYTRKPVGVVTSSVGGHVRHNLDHVSALLRGLRTGVVDYDDRDRGTAVEHDRFAALEAILLLEKELTDFCWADAPHLMKLTTLVSPDLPPVSVVTSPDRELAFVVSHTVHHNALIAVMAKLLGVTVPAAFGYAPSTIAHQRSRTCAR